MARGAKHAENPKRQITLFIVKAAAVLMLAAAPYLIFCGLPLAGLPDADEVTRVEITRIDDGLSKCATNAKDIELVRKAAELLRYAPFAVPREEAPRIAVTFITRGGEEISLRAGLSSVEYKDRTLKLRRRRLFVNVIEGIFFKEERAHNAPQNFKAGASRSGLFVGFTFLFRFSSCTARGGGFCRSAKSGIL